jgi:Fur family iron response transcriptional regulator
LNDTETDTRQQALTDLLQNHEISPTAQRLEIAKFLFQKQQHVCAEQILSNVNKQQAPVSKATVYNTLGLFASKGLLREVIVDPSKVFYDTNTEHHHHFYNTSNNVLSDISNEDILIQNLPELPEGTNIESIDVIVKIKNK